MAATNELARFGKNAGETHAQSWRFDRSCGPTLLPAGRSGAGEIVTCDLELASSHAPLNRYGYKVALSKEF
jgi:hypothetical protein